MKRFSILRIAAVLLVAMTGTLAPAAGERPFHASGEGKVSNILYGNGEATHLGRSRLYVDVDIYLLRFGIFQPYGGGILVSASGDILDLHFDGQEYEFDTETGVVSATLTYISGPPGRFQNATGSADVMFVFDPALQSFSFLIDGSIDY